MADETIGAPIPGPRKRGSWLRVLGWVFVVLIILLVVLYFVVTSSRFFQHTILPRVSKALNAEVTVSSAEINPFSQIILHDLKIQSTNQPALLTARGVRVNYSLWDIIAGDFRADEIVIGAPTIQLIENVDGSSNLDPLVNSFKSAGQSVKPAGKPAPTPKIDLRKITISNATVRRIQNHKNGTRDLVELTNVAVTITGLKNGEAGKVQFAAIVRDEDNPPAPAMYGLLQAKVSGSFNFVLTPDLTPGAILGDAQMVIPQAAGAFSDFAKLEGTLHCDFTPAEIKAVNLNFEKDGVHLGELRASGPFDARKSEGRLTVELLSVDKQVLNLFGAKSGFDFGATTISLTNQVELSKAGAAISVAGELIASKFQFSRTNQSTPPIELRANYNVSLDKAEKTAWLRTLNVAGSQNGRPLLRAELTSPMTLAWGNQTNAVGDSSFSFAVTKLNIADWKTFVGNFASEGTLDLSLKLLSQQGGRRLTFDATNQIQNLSVDVGGQHFSEVTLSLKTHGQSTDLREFNLSDYGLEIGKSNHPALTISGSGTYDRTNESADLQVTLRTTIARALQLIGQTNIVASSGIAELRAHVIQRQETQGVEGTLTLTNFTGRVAGNQFTNFGTVMALNLTRTPSQIEIHKAAGTLSENRKMGGSFDISGSYSLTNTPSQVTVKLSGFNESGVRPFLEPLLAGRRLVSVGLDGTASAQRNPNGDSAVQADLRIANLVVNDPAGQLPSAPLEAGIKLDVSLARQITDLRQLQITLTPTSRAKNEFQLQGRVDASKTNAVQGNLTLTADALDLTSYYDLFAATNKTAKASSKPATSESRSMTTAAQGTNQLPFANFVVDAKVREFYLREIAGTNLHAVVKLDRSRVLLKPFQITLNGSLARGTADVDLSVPGYKYALTFNATNVPFAPLWNTFKREANGEVSGTLSALVDINGVGTSGESLQKTLSGKFDIATTNLNLSVDRIQSPALKSLVVVVARMPEIVKNPAGATTSIVGGALESALGGKLSGGLSSDLRQSPIDVITARGTIGGGKVELQQATVRSTVFLANATGTITLAPELTNSAIQIPVGISLARPISERMEFVPENTPTNAGYVKFPDFYSESGTLGHPTSRIDLMPFGREALEKFGIKFPDLTGTNGVVGNVLQGVGGLLQGGANTNQPGTNQSPVNNLLNRFIGPGR